MKINALKKLFSKQEKNIFIRNVQITFICPFLGTRLVLVKKLNVSCRSVRNCWYANDPECSNCTDGDFRGMGDPQRVEGLPVTYL